MASSKDTKNGPEAYEASIASESTSYSIQKPAATEKKSRSPTQKIKSFLGSLGEPPTAEYDRQQAAKEGQEPKTTGKAFEQPSYAQNLPRH